MFSDVILALECGLAAWRETLYQSPASIVFHVLVYGACALLLIWTATFCRKPAEQWLWRGCGAFCLLLAANAPFDLHVLTSNCSECLARAQGWHDGYLDARLGIAVATLIIVVLVLTGIFLAARRHVVSKLLVVAGLSLIIGLGAIELVVGLAFEFPPQAEPGATGPLRPLLRMIGVLLILIAITIRQLVARSRGSHRPTSSNAELPAEAFQPRRH